VNTRFEGTLRQQLLGFSGLPLLLVLIVAAVGWYSAIDPARRW
jgi:hypothetical protein